MALRQELQHTLYLITAQRDQALLDLTHAQETIAALEAEIAAVKFHGDEALGRVTDSQGMPTYRQEEHNAKDTATQWIADTWLVSPSNARLLSEAERAWKRDIANPQQALNVITTIKKDQRLSRSDQLKCKLFLSAVFLISGRKEDACALANDVLRECNNEFRYKHLAGVAHFLRGRIFLELKSFSQAYWDFSLAVLTKGYHEKAKYYQRHTENRTIQHDSSETSPADTAPAGS